MVPNHIGVAPETSAVSLADLAPIAAAVQKQVTTDFGPIWGINATVSCFGSLDEIPNGYWKISIRDPGDAGDPRGLHIDQNGQPFAIVHARDTWSVTLSHEVIEMLVNPFGTRMFPGQSPDTTQGQVNFIAEVCDACNAESYTVDGIAVSEFCTPNYFDSEANAAVRYSCKNRITQPHQVLNGGYLWWLDPVSTHLFRLSVVGDNSQIDDFGTHAVTGLSLRSVIYLNTPEAIDARQPTAETLAAHAEARGQVRAAARAGSEALRRHIAKSMRRRKRNEYKVGNARPSRRRS